MPFVTNTIVPADASPAEIDRITSAAIAAGTELYTLDRGLLQQLDPDLIVTQDLCRVCALPAGSVDQAVAELGCTADVFSYDPMTMTSVLDEIERLGLAVGAPANDKVDLLRKRLVEVEDRVSGLERPRVLLLEWPDPPYTPGHWIPDQIEAAGGQALLAHPGERSSAASWSEIAASEADILVVAPCGFDGDGANAQLQEVVARPDLQNLPAVRSGKTFAIDGDAYVVRPGPRLVDGVEHLSRLFHPGAWR